MSRGPCLSRPDGRDRSIQELRPMGSLRRSWLPATLAAAALVAAGCGGGDQQSGTPATTTAQVSKEAQPGGSQQSPPTSPTVTPVRRIDTKSVVDVVRAEVKGGEASEGPSPENVLWLFPDLDKIHDEPLEVAVPKGLPELTPVAVVPASNPITKGRFELGRQLYFDPRVSKDGTVSCATCHDPAKGWTDHMPTSVGIGGQVGQRNAPTVLNTAYGRTMFWDGRAPSLEGQAQGPIQNKIEMGDQSYEEIVKRLREIAGYREQFAKVFGTDVTLDGMAKAIATFERVSALTGDSPFDRYRDLDDPSHNEALTESQKRGLVLFGEFLNDDDEFKTDVVRQKAKCTICHVGFNFTDEKFHNLGVGYDPSTGKFVDVGRWGATAVGAKDLADLGAFKTPTLRDLSRTAPYMHDGSETTLEEVIAFYDKGGNPNPYLDANMQPLKLTDQEKADLVAFMKALDGTPKPVDLPSLPPGPDGKAPDPRAALETPTKKVAHDPHGAMRAEF
jgi:cytochrome c peroxidase